MVVQRVAVAREMAVKASEAQVKAVVADWARVPTGGSAATATTGSVAVGVAGSGVWVEREMAEMALAR